ncbi:MAG TPA: hypothetical protein VK211_28550 [Kamptonema sp.]|nr:hypothetical protein [Kamptonema sp.]
MSRLIRIVAIYTISQSVYRSIRFILQQGTLKINGDNQEVRNEDGEDGGDGGDEGEGEDGNRISEFGGS